MIMKGLVLFALCLLAASGYEEEDDVLVLTDATIDEALQEFKGLLVEFYAPWCGHCKKLAPEYARAAKRLRAQDPPLRIAKMDATTNPTSAGKYGVKGYPALKWFVNAESKDYEGPREENGIVGWINKKLGPAVNVLGTVEALNSYIENNEIAVVLFAQAESQEAKIFEEVSKASEDSFFGLSTSSEALAAYKVTEPALVLFKKFDEPKVQFTGQFLVKPITDFVKANSLPRVMPFNDKTVDFVFKQQNHIIFVFRSDSASEIDAVMREVAVQTKDFVKFTYADLTKESNMKLAEYLGVKPTEQPLALAVAPNSGAVVKYKLTGSPITVESLTAFIEKYQKKELEAYYKTQEIPSESFDQGIRVLVGKNFESVVMDPTKDVMVEFYAPWCGHCKKLAPEYVEVAAYFKNNPNVVIAKMDATVNEAPNQSVQGFPTLKFFSSKNKAGVRYSGKQTKDGLIEFIEKNSTPVDKTKTEL